MLGTALTIASFVYYRLYENMRNIFSGRRNEEYDETQQIHSVTKIIQDVESVEVGGPEYQIQIKSNQTGFDAHITLFTYTRPATSSVCAAGEPCPRP